MNTKRILLALALALPFFCFCEKVDEPEVVEKPETVEPYEISIPKSSKVMVLGNVATFFLCQSPGEFYGFFENPKEVEEVDFEQYNVVFASNASMYGVESVESQFFKADDKYEFVVDVQQNVLEVLDFWAVAFAIPKDVIYEDIVFTATEFSGVARENREQGFAFGLGR